MHGTTIQLVYIVKSKSQQLDKYTSLSDRVRQILDNVTFSYNFYTVHGIAFMMNNVVKVLFKLVGEMKTLSVHMFGKLIYQEN